MAKERDFNTELAPKRRETRDIDMRVEDRERQSQQIHSNLEKLKHPSTGHSMVRENENYGGY